MPGGNPRRVASNQVSPFQKRGPVVVSAKQWPSVSHEALWTTRSSRGNWRTLQLHPLGSEKRKVPTIAVTMRRLERGPEGVSPSQLMTWAAKRSAVGCRWFGSFAVARASAASIASQVSGRSAISGHKSLLSVIERRSPLEIRSWITMGEPPSR
jgi:hypothetical protein